MYLFGEESLGDMKIFTTETQCHGVLKFLGVSVSLWLGFIFQLT